MEQHALRVAMAWCYASVHPALSGDGITRTALTPERNAGWFLWASIGVLFRSDDAGVGGLGGTSI
jgi:hypothetical protein